MSNTNQSSREENNDNESTNENQRRTKDKYDDDDDDSIYVDELFLNLISLYVRMQKMVNSIQRKTKYASYQLLSLLFCTTIFFYLGNEILTCYFNLLNSYPNLMMMKINQTHIIDLFFQDRVFFKEDNNKYLMHHYGYFIEFMKTEIMHLHLSNYHIEDLIERLGDLSIFMTSLPLVLNLSWWTNIITLTSAISTKISVKNKSLASLTILMYINVISVFILLVIHAIKNTHALGAYVKKKVQEKLLVMF